MIGLVDALCVLRDLRGDQVVISSMGSAREWPKLSRHALDFHYVPSAMGQSGALGLGIALARPGREVIALCGDGSLLMNLGALVTIAASGARNFALIVFDNGIYEVTGGQSTAATAGEARVDFAKLATACGIASATAFESLDAWRAGAAAALAAPGPRFITLKVAPVGDEYQLDSPGPIRERVRAFRQALQMA